METIDYSLVDWSRAQFALTAIYHWLFVPLTLGLGVILSVMETVYYKTGKPEWKRMTQFWMTLFGINFAIGVATGIILEFQFGTNWSNYSWFVGDIFGAPLAIEGILAFFMESTFIAVMFFGWNKVSKGFHLASSWLTVAGATISAIWILVANAWMQYPDGMTFNPETVRNEMTDFWSVLLSPVAINKILHTVTTSWMVGAAFVVGVSGWFLLKNREQDLAKKSIRIASIFGLAGTLLAIFTGDGSAQQVALRQPMKLAAMEGLYEGKTGTGLVTVGFLDPGKKDFDDPVKPFVFRMEIPYALSYLSFRDIHAFVPGINDLMKGGYTSVNAWGKKEKALSVEEKMRRGKMAVQALADFRLASKAGNDSLAFVHRKILETNYNYFGYGFIKDKKEVIPNVPLTFYAFRIMVTLGIFFLLFFILTWYMNHKDILKNQKWMLWITILAVPLAYLASQCGWVVTEVGRQPWVIQDIMPTSAAISNIAVSSVKTTFTMFAILFFVLLVVELNILFRQIKKGPDSIH